MNDFSTLGLAEPLLRALAGAGYAAPTPIQAKAIPSLLDGRDLIGIAQTGTGKTAAFALPILQRLSEGQRAQPRTCRALILTPTRELAAQIGDSLATYGRHLNLSHAVIYGGVGQKPQADALMRGVDVVVATPGRLLDLIGQGKLILAKLSVFVLDEADRMLDMGFIPDVRRIAKLLPAKRQSMLFSATMPSDVAGLALGLTSDAVRVEATPPATTVERIAQSVHFTAKAEKPRLLAKLLRDPALKRVIVFSRTKRGADKVARFLEAAGIDAAAIHGNKSQSQRERALDGFRAGRTRILVATDIAARGIDVDGVTHVVNFDLPEVPETYVHRIGRTARAGASGAAIAFCDPAERPLLAAIEKTIRRRVPVAGAEATSAPMATEARRPAAPATRTGHPVAQPAARPAPNTAAQKPTPVRFENAVAPRPARGPSNTRPQDGTKRRDLPAFLTR